MNMARALTAPLIRPLARALTDILSGAFNPGSLFAGGEQGGWYDFSDMSTLFQDSAGSVPVTAVEQPIGRVLDKSGRGNHLIQATAAARPVWSARKNLLTRTEDFADAAWTKNNNTVTTNSHVAPDGAMTADKIVPAAISAVHSCTKDVAATGLTTLTASLYAKADGYNKIALCDYLHTALGSAVVDLRDGTTANILNSVGTTTVTSAGNGWYRITWTYSGYPDGAISYSFGFAVLPDSGVTNSFSGTWTGDGVSGVVVWGAQFEPPATATRYQRVTTASDYDTAGFPHFARYDGVDDSLNTAATVDFTATDSVAVFAGTSRLSSATQAMAAELSASVAANNGSFYLATPETAATANAAFASKGTVLAADTETGVNIGTQYVLTGASDISGDTVRLRVNGVDGTAVLTDQGTGNFGNYTLFTGARNAASLLLNGQINQLITLGRTPTALEITNTEAYITAKTVNV